MKYNLGVLIAAFIFFSCSQANKTAKTVIRPVIEDTAGTELVENKLLDTLTVTPEKDETVVTNAPAIPYKPSYTRRWDLLHTSLNLRFDWQKERVMGIAKIKMTPVFYTVDTVELDAKTMEINSIILNNQVLHYVYKNDLLKINLGKKYTQKDTITLTIDYTGMPSENQTSGSAAITDDNGLYFINAHNNEPNLPSQIWSQGETEYNSRWFPTVDKPNERMTVDISFTVPDTMVTLSNGLKTASVKNADHTITDTWVMDQPIAPYLVMIAAGPFSVTNDQWQDIPLQYYVDKPYGPYAREIFNHTPEMLSFFSEKLGLKYPWKKFSQIIVKKYVSGAMENTTAVVFGDFIEKTHKELIDEPNDYIVAHEMFHHWFGDYVTCESWSNLTLNEGFADYSEYLWMEHQYGKMEADRHREESLNGYLSSVSIGKAHDLIDYRYENKENMFDAHSYNKGGLVLHMLRNYVGDDAFFTALHRYLTRNAYKSVEVHDLRLAFEETTGEDLHWFFDQWYLDDGHPSIKYTTDYDELNKSVTIKLEQTQNKKYPYAFTLPIDVDIHHADGTISRERVWMQQREQTLDIASKDKPTLVVVDPDRVLLVEWTEPELTASEYKTLWNKSNNYNLKLEALSALNEDKDYHDIWLQAVRHPYWNIRLRALDYPPSLKPEDISLLKSLSHHDPHSQVRAASIGVLSSNDPANIESDLDQILKADSAYIVIGEAIKAMKMIDPVKAKSYASIYKDEKNPVIQEAIADILVDKSDPSSIDYFENKIESDPSSVNTLLDKYIEAIRDLPYEDLYHKAELLFRQAIKKDIDKNTKLNLTRGIFEIKDILLNAALNKKNESVRPVIVEKVRNVKSWLQEIREKEKDIQMRELLKAYQ